MAWQRGLRFGKKGGLGRVVDDGLAVVLGEEFKDNAGVRKLEAKHLGDESGPADGVDGNNVGVGEAAQPANIKRSAMVSLDDEQTHQMPTTERGGMS